MCRSRSDSLQRNGQGRTRADPSTATGGHGTCPSGGCLTFHSYGAINWSNDPNGLFYKDGVWHLYYQFNPNGIGCDFGGMSWGHASSTDLMHWQEKSPVLYPDAMGAMYSGCSVVDHDNKAGFGNGAVLAYYTASGEKQVICLAVSTDGGETFWKYDRNPIVPSTGLVNFRDPKVVYDAKRGRWTMLVARGWDLGAEIWHSYNLMQWDFDGIFRVNIERCNMSQWECCDLMYFDQADKWVAVVSINPNGYITGSSTMYFVGSFDGVTFTPDEEDYPRWLDYGADCYAGVTFDNAPDGRKVMTAWMNNWDYAPLCPPQAWTLGVMLGARERVKRTRRSMAAGGNRYGEHRRRLCGRVGSADHPLAHPGCVCHPL